MSSMWWATGACVAPNCSSFHFVRSLNMQLPYPSHHQIVKKGLSKRSDWDWAWQMCLCLLQPSKISWSLLKYGFEYSFCSICIAEYILIPTRPTNWLIQQSWRICITDVNHLHLQCYRHLKKSACSSQCQGRWSYGCPKQVRGVLWNARHE